MDMTNIPRKYLLGLIGVMLVILITIVTVNPGNFAFRDATDYDAQRKIVEDEVRQYQALLDAIQPNYLASQQLLEKIATEDIVRTEVNAALNANQKVVIPTVADSEIVIESRTDKAAVVDYLNRLGSMITNHNEQTQVAVNQTFADSADVAQILAAQQQTKTLANNIRGMPVPRDATEMHKAYITTFDTFSSFLNTAGSYSQGTALEPWPQIYGQYTVIDNKLGAAQSEFTRLSNKFSLTPEDFNIAANGNDNAHNNDGLVFINTANAQIGFGVQLVTDIWAKAEAGIRAGLARSFAKFATTMLAKLVAQIEKSFAIASQLYYSQDLGRYYSVEYMKKFVADPTEQDIIQKFLPQYFCVDPNPGELRQIFTAKARANQGTDLVLDPNDPQFLTKLAKLGGDERNYPEWWEDYYTTLANQTRSSAESAATKEVLSPGLKSGRDLVNGQINKTMASIFNTQEAAISGTIQLGTSNADNAISQIVAGIVENMVNQFVFTPIGGGTAGGNGIGIIKEQNVCLRTAQINPIAPIAQTNYQPEN